MVSDLKLIDWSSFAESMPQKGWWCCRDAKCHMMSHCCNMMSQWFRSWVVTYVCLLYVCICMLMPAYVCLWEACTCRVAWDTPTLALFWLWNALHLGACDIMWHSKITREAIALLVPACFAPDFTGKVSLFKNTCFSDAFVETHDDWLDYIVFFSNA